MEANLNYSFHDLLVGNGYKAGTDAAITTTRVKAGLPSAPSSPFQFSKEQRAMIDRIDARGVSDVLQSIVTTNGVTEFGELVDLACRERRTLSALYKIQQWSGMNASAAHAAIPYSNPSISGKTVLSFADNVHTTGRNVDLRGVADKIENGWIKYGKNYTVYCHMNGEDVVLCGPVPLDLNVRSDPLFMMGTPALTNMGLNHYLTAGLNPTWAKHKYKSYTGGPVSAIIVNPDGFIYALPGNDYPEECVWGALSKRNIAAAMHCSTVPMRENAYPDEHFYYFALKYNTYRPPFKINSSRPHTSKFSGKEQVLNRCYRPRLQSLVLRNEDSYLSFIDVVCKNVRNKSMTDMNDCVDAWEKRQATLPSTETLKARREMSPEKAKAVCNKPVEVFDVENYFAPETPPVPIGFAPAMAAVTTAMTSTSTYHPYGPRVPTVSWNTPWVDLRGNPQGYPQFQANVGVVNAPGISSAVHPMAQSVAPYAPIPATTVPKAPEKLVSDREKGVVVISSDDLMDEDDDRLDEKEMEAYRQENLRSRLRDADPIEESEDSETELEIDDDDEEEEEEYDCSKDPAFRESVELLQRSIPHSEKKALDYSDVSWMSGLFEAFFRRGFKNLKDENLCKATIERSTPVKISESIISAKNCTTIAVPAIVDMRVQTYESLGSKIHDKFAHTAKKVLSRVASPVLYMPKKKRYPPPSDILASFNKVYDISGKPGGGFFNQAQAKARKAYGAIAPHIAIVPAEGCVMYGPFVGVPSWWMFNEKEKKYNKYEVADGKARHVDQGILFTHVKGIFFCLMAKGVDEKGRIHAYTIAASRDPVQIYSFTHAYPFEISSREGSFTLGKLRAALQALAK